MSYSSEVMADSPRVYYRMDEASGQTQDSSGNALHSTSTTGAGSATYQEAGALASDAASKSIKFNPAFCFNTPDDALLDVGDVFTIEMWIKRDRSSTDEYVLSKETGAYAMRIDSTDHLGLDRYATVDIVRSTTTLTSDGSFHHCVATKDGSTVKLYIDAVDVTGSVNNDTCTNNTGQLHIGQDAVALPFQGWLDEVAVYPTALSAARVQAHYNAAFGGTATVTWLTA